MALCLREVRETIADRPRLLATQQVGVAIVMVVCGLSFRLVEWVDGDGPAMAAGVAGFRCGPW